MLGNIVHIKQLLVLAIVADIEVKIALSAQKRCLCASIGFISADKKLKYLCGCVIFTFCTDIVYKAEIFRKEIKLYESDFCTFFSFKFLTAQIPFAFHADCIAINTVSSVFSGA